MFFSFQILYYYNARYLGYDRIKFEIRGMREGWGCEKNISKKNVKTNKLIELVYYRPKYTSDQLCG
jgi:hypothetical protein